MTYQSELASIADEIESCNHKEQSIDFYINWLPSKLARSLALMEGMYAMSLELVESRDYRDFKNVEAELEDIIDLANRLRSGKEVSEDVKQKHLEYVKRGVPIAIRHFLKDCKIYCPKSLNENVPPNKSGTFAGFLFSEKRFSKYYF